MTFEDFYKTMKKYVKQLKQEDLSVFKQGIYSYQFNVTGDGSGIFYMEINDGTPAIQPFDYKNCLCSFTADSAVIRSIFERKLAPVEAYSTGRLSIHGDVSAAFLLAEAFRLLL